MGNDLFYQPDLTLDPIPLSDDGQTNAVYNGVPDWLYEGWFSRASGGHGALAPPLTQNIS